MLLAGVDVYALGLILYFLVRLITGYRLWPVALFSNFLQFALMPALVILPIMVVLRRWRRALLVALPALAFLWLYGGLLLPGRTDMVDCGNPGCVKLTMMTFNLGDGGTETPPEDIMKVIMESGADVVGLQEVTAAQAEAMQNQMMSVYPYQITHEAGKNVHGIALMSRYPILEWEPFYGNPPNMPNLDVTLDVGGRQLHVMVVHPPPPGWSPNWLRLYQARAVGEVRLYQELLGDRPTVLIGDLNATDQSEEHAILTRVGLVDAYRKVGFGFGPTFPSHKGYGYPFDLAIPLIRVDYIFHTRHFNALRAWVGSDIESDHLPVLAELAWPVEGGPTANAEGDR
jgi:vancomycin resistance protein VanJ